MGQEVTGKWRRSLEKLTWTEKKAFHYLSVLSSVKNLSHKVFCGVFYIKWKTVNISFLLSASRTPSTLHEFIFLKHFSAEPFAAPFFHLFILKRLKPAFWLTVMRLEDCVSLLMKIKLQINAGSFVLLHNETKWLGWGSWVYWLSWALMLSEAGIEGWRGGKQCTMGRSWCCCHDNRSMHRWDGDKSICFYLRSSDVNQVFSFWILPCLPVVTCGYYTPIGK